MLMSPEKSLTNRMQSRTILAACEVVNILALRSVFPREAPLKSDFLAWMLPEKLDRPGARPFERRHPTCARLRKQYPGLKEEIFCLPVLERRWPSGRSELTFAAVLRRYCQRCVPTAFRLGRDCRSCKRSSLFHSWRA